MKIWNLTINFFKCENVDGSSLITSTLLITSYVLNQEIEKILKLNLHINSSNREQRERE